MMNNKEELKESEEHMKLRNLALQETKDFADQVSDRVRLSLLEVSDYIVLLDMEVAGSEGVTLCKPYLIPLKQPLNDYRRNNETNNC